ncbi:MAG: glucoamylase family protein [Gemmatimonadaceae bacterium]
MRLRWCGYDEGMIVYILAPGSPTDQIDPAGWTEWKSTFEWADLYGQTHVNFPPLFGHQYSHVWIGFRGIQGVSMRGKGIDHFENSASDDILDDGTLVPTAPGGSVPFAPEIAVPALIAEREKYGDKPVHPGGFEESGLHCRVADKQARQ